MEPIAILNTSIITAYGEFKYQPMTLEQAATRLEGYIASNLGFLSAVGHVSTAQILSELFGVEIPVNRIQFAQEVGQEAIVFKLRGRAPEGTILGRDEIEKIGYEFGLLVRNA
jgi:Domain of unknown function (DUF1874)